MAIALEDSIKTVFLSIKSTTLLIRSKEGHHNFTLRFHKNSHTMQHLKRMVCYTTLARKGTLSIG